MIYLEEEIMFIQLKTNKQQNKYDNENYLFYCLFVVKKTYLNLQLKELIMQSNAPEYSTPA